MAGKLIVFEGGEGGGKTTQLQRTQAWLEQSGWWAYLQAQGAGQLRVTREPGGTDLCQSIRQLLLTPTSAASGGEFLQDRAELLLYAADRAQHVEWCVRPQLAKGDWVLCDRYTDSTIAYQGYGRGLDLGLIEQLNAIATGGLMPDLTFWLDLDPEVGLERTQRRGSRDRLEQANLEFHQRVRQGFARLAAQFPQRIVRIDASQSQPDVASQIQHQFVQHLTGWFGPKP